MRLVTLTVLAGPPTGCARAVTLLHRRMRQLGNDELTLTQARPWHRSSGAAP